MAATSASIDPTTANTAAGAAVDNNWLATQQIVQFKKEYEEAKGFGETGKVFAKWAYISSKQDVLTQFGIGKGLAQSGWNDVTGLAEFVAHPIEGLKGLKELVNNPAAREQFGETLIKELNVKIDRVTVALEKGGDENAVLLGQSIGEIAWQVGSIATGVGGAATGGVALAKAGIKVGGAQLEKMAELARMEKVAANNAKNLNPMSAMTDSEAAVLIDRNVLEAGAKATGGAAGKVDDLASTSTPVRPTPQKSEIDVGADLGAGARPQVSYKNGQEVPCGTSGSVRPDWCVGNVCSVEVKNYNNTKNQNGLISNVFKQALQRAENLPKSMQQQVVIDVRGQMVTVNQERNIIKGIVQKSNGAIKPEAIEFKRN
ncbi:hypothetical protein V2K16_26655 [Pseudomonas alliivorans]|uniref:hypothetical protein n=1 Tax=Pseudomonas alliivorans TaxID=2810613 RepID=UPI001AEB6D8F|nr:hypothetical protein [Pseudomonas alliivorans]MBP0943677.1 hypothetical protein [Pseudomonas alliivorans]MEE4881895.1 hypothetical protein [Pseudomonas alliivorans]MEE4933261.1 hypothetical protein [Pseudomonas alliivorans]MEE4938545.1 hypothetical protein [Pseudomonas alliivorans]MEE4943756.1 hypothetical protein [Pseudomonas alliivorans]